MSDYWDPEFESGKNGQYYDLEKAKKLVKKSGYDGQEINYVALSLRDGARIAVLLQGMLSRVGLNVKVNLHEEASWRKNWRSGTYDLLDVGWIADLDPDETYYPEWHSTGKWNFGKYSNPEFDRALEEARQTLDVAKRRAAYDRAQRIITDDCPCAFLAHVKENKVFAKYVKNFNPIPADLINMHDVWLDKG
jgi:peptide/nickel transport system substrate-binding protein